MTDGELKNRIVEIYLTASELCGAGLAGFSGTDPVNEINNLIGPMRNQYLTPYKNKPVNMADWNPCAQKLAELIYELRQRGWIK